MIKPKFHLVATTLLATSLVMGCGTTDKTVNNTSSPSKTSTSDSSSKNSTSTSNATASTTSNQKQYTVALINGNNIDPFFLTLWHGAADEAQKYGMKLMEVAPSKYDYTQQVPLIMDMIAKKVDAIVLSPDSDTGLNETMAKAKEAGIPIVVVNKHMDQMQNPDSSYAFFGSDNLLMSKTGGEILAKLLNGKGTIAVLNSVPGNKGTYDRAIGVYNIIKEKYPDMKVLDMQYSDDSPTKAQSITTSLIQSHPDLAGIFAVDSFTGQGVATGVLAANKAGQVKVVAIDAEPEEVTLMKQGVVQALIAQQPYSEGTHAIDDVYQILTGNKDKIKREEIFDATVITPENLDKPGSQNLLYQNYHQ